MCQEFQDQIADPGFEGFCHCMLYYKSLQDYGRNTMLSKKLAAVDMARCVACGVCENTCPIGAVKVRRGCYAAVEAERCVGCGKCAKLCPVGCIEVKARDEA